MYSLKKFKHLDNNYLLVELDDKVKNNFLSSFLIGIDNKFLKLDTADLNESTDYYKNKLNDKVVKKFDGKKFNKLNKKHLTYLADLCKMNLVIFDLDKLDLKFSTDLNKKNKTVYLFKHGKKEYLLMKQNMRGMVSKLPVGIYEQFGGMEGDPGPMRNTTPSSPTSTISIESQGAESQGAESQDKSYNSNAEMDQLTTQLENLKLYNKDFVKGLLGREEEDASGSNTGWGRIEEQQRIEEQERIEEKRRIEQEIIEGKIKNEEHRVLLHDNVIIINDKKKAVNGNVIIINDENQDNIDISNIADDIIPINEVDEIIDSYFPYDKEVGLEVRSELVKRPTNLVGEHDKKRLKKMQLSTVEPTAQAPITSNIDSNMFLKFSMTGGTPQCFEDLSVSNQTTRRKIKILDGDHDMYPGLRGKNKTETGNLLLATTFKNIFKDYWDDHLDTHIGCSHPPALESEALDWALNSTEVAWSGKLYKINIKTLIDTDSKNWKDDIVNNTIEDIKKRIGGNEVYKFVQYDASSIGRQTLTSKSVSTPDHTFKLTELINVPKLFDGGSGGDRIEQDKWEDPDFPANHPETSTWDHENYNKEIEDDFECYSALTTDSVGIQISRNTYSEDGVNYHSFKLILNQLVGGTATETIAFNKKNPSLTVNNLIFCISLYKEHTDGSIDLNTILNSPFDQIHNSLPQKFKYFSKRDNQSGGKTLHPLYSMMKKFAEWGVSFDDFRKTFLGLKLQGDHGQAEWAKYRQDTLVVTQDRMLFLYCLLIEAPVIFTSKLHESIFVYAEETINMLKSRYKLSLIEYCKKLNIDQFNWPEDKKEFDWNEKSPQDINAVIDGYTVTSHNTNFVVSHKDDDGKQIKVGKIKDLFSDVATIDGEVGEYKTDVAKKLREYYANTEELANNIIDTCIKYRRDIKDELANELINIVNKINNHDEIGVSKDKPPSFVTKLFFEIIIKNKEFNKNEFSEDDKNELKSKTPINLLITDFSKSIRDKELQKFLQKLADMFCYSYIARKQIKLYKKSGNTPWIINYTLTQSEYDNNSKNEKLLFWRSGPIGLRDAVPKDSPENIIARKPVSQDDLQKYINKMTMIPFLKKFFNQEDFDVMSMVEVFPPTEETLTSGNNLNIENLDIKDYWQLLLLPHTPGFIGDRLDSRKDFKRNIVNCCAKMQKIIGFNGKPNQGFTVDEITRFGTDDNYLIFLKLTSKSNDDINNHERYNGIIQSIDNLVKLVNYTKGSDDSRFDKIKKDMKDLAIKFKTDTIQNRYDKKIEEAFRAHNIPFVIKDNLNTILDNATKEKKGNFFDTDGKVIYPELKKTDDNSNLHVINNGEIQVIDLKPNINKLA